MNKSEINISLVRFQSSRLLNVIAELIHSSSVPVPFEGYFARKVEDINFV